ncbi:hypothetical protein AYI70_g921 [Smittium culicis]|uniref:Uncharacterized protein n=1 Tax=Smittium culicis TaxID=133412 RepID=A0A1R1YER1_9FUNG|nr:hypothetical protein AYI70_g921 [Smittium culicis]
MKITFIGLALAFSAIFAVSASPVVEDSLKNDQSGTVLKRSGSYRGGRWGRGYRHGLGHGYYRFGRNWYFNSLSDTSFINSLVYRPLVYYGQRFQFLYQNSPAFRKYWNSDYHFRNRWNTDPIFRDAWFASLYPSGYDDYRIGGIYNNYLGRFGYSRYGRERSWGRGGNWNGRY